HSLCIYISLYPRFLSSFPDSPPTSFSPLSLHDALPIFIVVSRHEWLRGRRGSRIRPSRSSCAHHAHARSVLQVGRRVDHDVHAQIGKHTSELQSRENLVCRLLLEKKKNKRRDSLRL